MEITLYIYFLVNFFISGCVFTANSEWEEEKLTVIADIVLFCLFGLLILFSYPFSKLFSPILIEIKFLFRFYFTSYFDKIFINDDKVKYLKDVAKIAEKSTKQFKRHNKMIQKKYATTQKD